MTIGLRAATGIQAIADRLVRLGYDVNYVSVRHSLLSLFKGDFQKFPLALGQ